MKLSATFIGLLLIVVFATGETGITTNLDNGKFRVIVSAQTQNQSGPATLRLISGIAECEHVLGMSAEWQLRIPRAPL
jgi:hypothetical protein